MKKIFEKKQKFQSLLIDKFYQPKKIESATYKFWEKNEFFKPNNDKTQDSFCIVMPPPNITGNIHMGHALQQTIMDIIIRYNRMKQKNTLWQGGTDHAGIATQMLVEQKLIHKEQKTRYDYGRKEFIKKIQTWKKKSIKNISLQMKKLGNSIYWKLERFTMDRGFSKAVKKAFIDLYEKKIIYRTKSLVNWDSKLNTAISDLEVENKEINGTTWYIRYYFFDNNIYNYENKDYIVIATTRPETIFGDVAIAVNPQDSRYEKIIGRRVLLPLTNRKIPIISDQYVDPKKGTGCMKITPAHDFNDYEIAKLHNLPMINIFDENCSIKQTPEIFNTKKKYKNFSNINIPKMYKGLNRFLARKIIINQFKILQLLDSEKKEKIFLPYGDRSNTVIEPMLKDQWYLRVEPLAKKAIKIVKDDQIEFIPKKYKKIYLNWMKNIKDWCISRQIWWGHRIPAWYDKNGKIYVGKNETDIRKKNNIPHTISLHQDEDVLDTWFSSALWTFAALGWPQNIEMLKNFHPTNILVSGFDIIFFWIARMIMLTQYFIKDKKQKPQIPFKKIYITGLILDEQGKKMSKSKGNIIDPIDIINGISLKKLIKKRTTNMMQPKLSKKISTYTKKKYPNGIQEHGADALRFALAMSSATMQDINLDMNRFLSCRNFCNKLWNASRYVLINTKDKNCGYQSKNSEIKFSLTEKWIITEFNHAIKLYNNSIKNYRFDIASNTLYEFTWNCFCDWYLEISKFILKEQNEIKKLATRYTLIKILESLLRLAHPIIPFITEVIWQQIKKLKNIKQNTIMLQNFPKFNTKNVHQVAQSDFKRIQKIIISIRNIKSKIFTHEKNIKNIFLNSSDQKIKNQIKENLDLIKFMTKITSINVLNKRSQEKFHTIREIDKITIYYDLKKNNHNDI